MDLDVLIKLAGAVGGILLAIHQFAKTFNPPRPKQDLLVDLEILDKTPDSVAGRKHLEDSLNLTFSDIYNVQNPRKKMDKGRVFLLPFIAVLMAYWSYTLSKDGFSSWSVLLGIIAFTSISSFIDEFWGSESESKKRRREKREEKREEKRREKQEKQEKQEKNSDRNTM